MGDCKMCEFIQSVGVRSSSWETVRPNGAPRHYAPEAHPPAGSAKEILACAPAIGGNIEITLTYPHTASFLRSNSEKQKKLLTRIFQLTCAGIPSNYIDSMRHYFEYDKNGAIHCHGWLQIKDIKLYPIGAICDIAKACLNQYPKKYAKFFDHCVFAQYNNYKCPQCKIQYRYTTSEEDVKRFANWKEYCTKLQ